ncbi:ATP-binding transport protein [Streptococcus pneumoniae]|jgi:ABC transporter related protein|uniref:ABC transporter ATP-binding protein n=1 Tax=Streptococcus TaxID=1301 RepID=UPI000449A4AD|nr:MULTISPECIES: ATP-binding cassette domain-containing protein [Streptococcus]EUB18453.1 ABC transporter, ATP-binding protein [Streptococcus sp. ACC21]EWC98147.1 ABC transporter, ATP-binding protein [Streptococcus sp. AC15]VNH69333.1 ATP-binding transport protein [Streptococcus pneumoniae]
MLINVETVGKDFIIYKREKGFVNSIKNFINRKKEIKRAVHDLNFSIKSGDIIGYIGPNGAGKSTTIKMMSGILTPTTGKILLDGIEPYNNRRKIAHKIGVVFGQRTQLQWDLPVIDSFELMKEIYSIPKEKYEMRYKELIELFDMKEFIEIPVRQLSLGQRMRADIALSLLHDPDILFLDEPTIGLDATAKEVIRLQIQRLADNKNKIVILTSHDMEDVETVCNRIIYIDKGEKYFDGSVEEFKKNYNQLRFINFVFEDKVDGSFIPKLQNVSIEKISGSSLTLSFDREKAKVKDILEIINQNFLIKDFWVEDEKIDDVVRRAYRLEKNNGNKF